MKEIENVRMIFTISGGHIENILDGLNEYNIRAIDVRHEQAEKTLAFDDGLAAATGKPVLRWGVTVTY